MKLNILFVHSVCPAQFSDLCEYLNTSGAANAYYLTTPGNLVRNQSRYTNLLGYTPDGNIMAANSYYFSGKVERAGRMSTGLYRALKELLKSVDIDLIVAHGSWGSPHLIFDEFDIPIITYIEFPSYADHGWDPAYPPTDSQRLTDKNMQMLSFYQAMKSEATLVPSEYAKSMFPGHLQQKITALFEGFDPQKIKQREPSGVQLPARVKTLGFAARDLSSAKGLESFIATAACLIQRSAEIHFVVIGDPKSTTYGYEQVFLDEKYGKDSGISFIDHLMKIHQVDPSYFTLTGKLPYAQFSDLVHHIDLFMYPVKYGSGNWGLMELLVRGCAVVAADRCYVSELIEHNVNGVLVNEDNPASWANTVYDLINDDLQRTRLGENAQAAASAYRLDTVATTYMTLFNTVVQTYQSDPARSRNLESGN